MLSCESQSNFIYKPIFHYDFWSRRTEVDRRCFCVIQMVEPISSLFHMVIKMKFINEQTVALRQTCILSPPSAGI